MRHLFRALVIVFIAFTSSAFADTAMRIQDPGEFCEDLFANISPFKSGDIAKKVAAAIGKPEASETMANALKLLDGKQIDFAKKVIDKDFNNALRQIVYYAYVEN